MDDYLLAALLLVLTVFLYVDELMEDHPNRLKAAVYVLGALVSFISITLTLQAASG